MTDETGDLLKAIVNALTRSDPPPNSVRGLVAGSTPRRDNPSNSLLGSISPAPAPNSLESSLGELLRGLAPRRENPFNSLLGSLAPQPPENLMGLLSLGFKGLGAPTIPRPPLHVEPKKRGIFFSFHYADIHRVNNVRNAMQFQKDVKDASCFIDKSVWEKAKLTAPESLKGMIQREMQFSSVVCVLFGSETWARRWVRYEIARSVIEKKGLMAASINSLPHIQDGVSHTTGPNPLEYMGVGKIEDGTDRLFEVGDDGRWRRYRDYHLPVSLPKYLATPSPGHLSPLNRGAMTYDFQQQNGWKNLGEWADLAAKLAGRL
ncbi:MULTISPECIES: TIR domain-containing protein [unclassified Mesorhizobium]|uniref:TIR domain-containing protein n=1 Tax=unclassified Mesorhizobium TaxID=325217 RepID=UPI0009DE8953|nr:TIR domain-containing protein [Mesorhizobium sp. L103C131B0]